MVQRDSLSFIASQLVSMGGCSIIIAEAFFESASRKVEYKTVPYCLGELGIFIW